MHIVQGDPGVPEVVSLEPWGSQTWSVLNQYVYELLSNGAIEPAPLSQGFYNCIFLVTNATEEWRPILDIFKLNAF